MDTVITHALRAEGLARELVRRIQTQRKNAGFNIEDRIATWYQAGDDLAAVVSDWRDYIQAETLTVALQAGPPPADAHVESHTIEGAEIRVGVRRVGG